MPNIPKTGAAGQVPAPFAGTPPVGPHEEADVESAHGADEAYDVPFMWGAKFNQPYNAGKSGMTTSHPALGGK